MQVTLAGEGHHAAWHVRVLSFFQIYPDISTWENFNSPSIYLLSEITNVRHYVFKYWKVQ